VIDISAGLRRAIDAITRIPRHPIRQLLLWYAAVGTVGGLLAATVPVVRRAVLSAPLIDAASAGTEFGDALAAPVNALAGDLMMVIVMVGTLLLTVPVSWGYMAVREREGFDQSVVQTIVVLPVVVAAIMMIVQHSLALAFALAGVSAAVRFRNTLKDVADATYVFLALGIGIAAGVGALAAAGVMSFIFIFVSVTLWRCDFGSCPSTVAYAAAGRDAAGAVNGAEPPTAPRNGVLSIQVTDASVERGPVEDVLGQFTKKWKLERLETEAEGGALLRYRVRLRKSASPDTVVHEVVTHGGRAVAAAAFDSLPSRA
jgi:hypothetical protein